VGDEGAPAYNPQTAGIQAATVPSKQNRALIVAISEYEHRRETSGIKGWSTINSDNDVPLIKEALSRHGFQDIRVLPDKQAKKSDITAAWRELVRSSKKGDTLVFHFSGHGQQVTDRGVLDEPDGYDEAMVPYDAPMPEDDGYKGDKHLTDDEFRVLIDEARLAVGPSGNVVAWVDSCYSGSIGRGVAMQRGAIQPIGKPHPNRHKLQGQEAKSGIVDMHMTSRGPSDVAGAEKLAPYIIFSASAYNTEARETYDADQGYIAVGSLSYGLSRSLSQSQFTAKSSYRDLFEEVALKMRANGVPNEPEHEGNVDSLLFSGSAVPQAPFFSVKEVSDDKTVWIDAGILLGLRKGSVVELHRSGTRQPSRESLLAEGEVKTEELASAKVSLKTTADMKELTTARVFVKQYNYGGTALSLKFADWDEVKDKDLANLKIRFEEHLKQLKVRNIKVVKSGYADLTVRIIDDTHIRVERSDYGTVILGPLSSNRKDLLNVIGNRIQDFALNRYFGKLEVESSNLDVDFEIIPVKVSECENPRRRTKETCKVTHSVRPPTVDDGIRTYCVGDWFVVKVHNKSKTDVNIAILDLMSDGTIESLWQVYGKTDKNKFSIEAYRELPPLYRFDKPSDAETLLLIATNEWINTDLIVTPPHERGLQPQETTARGPEEGAKGTLGPLDPIMGKNARTETYYDPQFVQVKKIQFKVVPAP